MMGSCLNKGVSLFPPRLIPLSSTSYMLLIMATSSPFDMPAVVSSGQGLTARLQTCVRPTLSVLNAGNNTLTNSFNHTLCLSYRVTWYRKTYLNLMVLLIWSPVDHFSDFYKIDRIPFLQSAAVVQATKQHLRHNRIPHTLLTDNGSKYTSDLFKEFTKTYKFNHITSSPYWSQSNVRAEGAVKSAKHILRTAKDVDLALLSDRNNPPAGHTFSHAQRLLNRVLCSKLPQPITTLEPRHCLHDMVVFNPLHRKLQQKQAYDKHARPLLPNFAPGSYVFVKPSPNSQSKASVPRQIIGCAGP